jgi:hypothetical protein
MRINELITEMKRGKITKRQQQATRGLNTYGDVEHVNGDYVSFKLGQAMAMADGSGKPLDIDAKSWHGKQKTTQPYTEIEQAMFDQAAKAVGASSKNINKGDMKSRELDSTYTVSPVANWMKTK